MKRKELATKVYNVVNKMQPVKAFKIAEVISKESGDLINRKSVNSVLYSELKDRVVQDDSYQWRIADSYTRKNIDSVSNLKKGVSLNDNEKINDASDSYQAQVLSENTTLTNSNKNLSAFNLKFQQDQVPQTLLGKLANYYLECMSFERDTEVSVYSTSKYGKPEYVQLNSLPNLSSKFGKECGQENVRNLILTIKKGSSNQKLYLGYPVFLRTSSKGEYTKLEPLFLFSFDLEGETGEGIANLSIEPPRLNIAGFKGYAEESGNLFDDLIQLQHELGLDQSFEDLPNLEELMLRLKQLRPLWPWVQNLDPRNLDSTIISDYNLPGIYNSAILVKGESAKFTKGLEKELNYLKSILNQNDYSGSVLAQMFGESESNINSTEIDIIEAVQLNYEQKKAVESVFNNHLTVITGPPGTGKSQVVTSMLVNAARQGWKVLLTSKNNKAVEVVEQRVNGLSQQPFVLRLGGKELQSSLSDKIINLISNQKSKESISSYKCFNEKHNFLASELKEIFSLMEDTIDTRNKIDKIDQILESAKRKIPKSFFENNNKNLYFSINHFESKIKKLRVKKNRCNENFILKTYWNISTWFGKAEFNLVSDITEFLDKNGLLKYKNNSESNLDEIYECINDLKLIVEKLKEYNELKKKIKNLKSFEELCISYDDIHSELVDVDSDLWKNWLNLISYRMNDRQRKAIGEYASTLKYIIEVNSSGEKINKKTWSDYNRLTQEVANLLPVWAVTSLSVSGRLPLEPGIFDLVIIDEASQCDIASVLPLLYRAKRVVVLGDPNQLRHITALSGKQDLQLIQKNNLNNLITWGYAKNSCFDLAVSISKNVITLREHHRSHQDIIQFSNQVYYGGSLRVATKSERLKKLKGSNETNVNWLSVSGKVEKYRGSGACNRQEAQAVFDYIEDLVKNRGYKGTIGVVTPFRGQAIIINELFAKSEDITKYLNDAELLVDTVHKFQGDEKDIIIFSSVISNGMSQSAIGFLKSQGNLFNVAITRARSHLTVIGDQSACKESGVSYLEKFVDYVDSLKDNHQRKNLLEQDLSVEYPKSVYDPVTVSDWEIKFYKAMHAAGLKPIPQYREDKYRLDFAIFDGERKLNIEVDGEKYHKDWDGSLILEDQVRNDRLRELGWSVKRFWVYQIRDEEETCVNEIIDWLKSEKKKSA